MKKGNDLGRDSIPSLVLRLAIPTMVAQLVNVLYSIVDRMYIGHIEGYGDLALAGAGVCGPIVTLLTSFGTLIGLGGSIQLAMRMGEGNQKKAKQILSNSFLMLTVFSLILTVLFLLIKDHLLLWFGASEQTFPYADTYLTIYTLGTFFALMAVGLNYFINCQGFAGVGMITVLIGTICNIALDPLFIFVFQMGVAGAAIATVISQFFSCAFAFCFLLFSKRVSVRISLGNYSLPLMGKILSIGFSPFLILASDSLLLIATNTVLHTYGGSQGDMLITTATIVQSYMMLITSPMLGISGGTQAIISFNYGAADTKRVRQTEKCVLLLCLAFTTVMFFVTRLLPGVFIRLFTTNPEISRLSIWGIGVYTMMIIPLSFQYILVDGLTAMERTKTALYLSIFRKTFYILLVFLLPQITREASNVFFAEPIADLVSSVQSTILFLLIFKKHMQRREKQVELLHAMHQKGRAS
ncbi:MAG TPA: MATE family efflux transporter [Candidatus Limivivens merdigallinarum]|uniref:Multidrug export protein MepA n=1 Tax=Candidatus Limivivens merdigallinarum TaxID=2840859 RepID=A0A9D0ZYQ2_9FIRM|nr:MATE family efflux transporter [Candidatus Limivivens merdigallinarum]